MFHLLCTLGTEQCSMLIGIMFTLVSNYKFKNGRQHLVDGFCFNTWTDSNIPIDMFKVHRTQSLLNFLNFLNVHKRQRRRIGDHLVYRFIAQ